MGGQQLGKSKGHCWSLWRATCCNLDLEKGLRKQNGTALEDIKYIKIWALLWSVGRYQRALSACYYLKKKLYNMKWKLPIQMQGRMQIITWLEYKHNGFELERWEKWRDAMRHKDSCFWRSNDDFKHFL